MADPNISLQRLKGEATSYPTVSPAGGAAGSFLLELITLIIFRHYDSISASQDQSIFRLP